MTLSSARTGPSTSASSEAGADLTAELFRCAREHPSRPALHLPRGPLARRLAGDYRTTTYADLAAHVDAVAGGLRSAGVVAGMRTAVLVPPGEDFFVVIYALLRIRAVPVLIDPGIGRASLKTCLREADPEAFIGIGRAALAQRLLRWCPRARIVVVTGTPGRLLAPAGFGGLIRQAQTLRDIRSAGAGTSPVAHTADDSPGAGDHLAAVAFTSGSTGLPKGVEYTSAQLQAQQRLLRETYAMRQGEVSLATFPPFALLGPAMGLTTVIPPMDATRPASVDAEMLLAAVDRFGATVMFGSPALLETVSRWGVSSGRRGSTLTRVISAGAPVPRSVQRRMLPLLTPGAQVHTPYGATEALPVTTIASGEILGLPSPGICVGRPVPGVDVGVFALSGRPGAPLTSADALPPGTIGEIVVRGPNVTAAYLARPEATAAAKTRWDDRLAHRMGDAGYFDDEGRLWFCGRVAHRVVTSRGTMWSVPCEEVFNAHPAVRRSALVGVGTPGHQRPVICIETEPDVRKDRALADELLQLAATSQTTAAIGTLLFVSSMPVDIRHNSKIRREDLAVEAAERLAR